MSARRSIPAASALWERGTRSGCADWRTRFSLTVSVFKVPRIYHGRGAAPTRVAAASRFGASSQPPKFLLRLRQRAPDFLLVQNDGELDGLRALRTDRLGPLQLIDRQAPFRQLPGKRVGKEQRKMPP